LAIRSVATISASTRSPIAELQGDCGFEHPWDGSPEMTEDASQRADVFLDDGGGAELFKPPSGFRVDSPSSVVSGAMTGYG
jgi:hypothetical protein